MDEEERRIWARAKRAIDAAITVQKANCAKRGEGYYCHADADAVQLYHGYAEPGYEANRVATGNWNANDHYDRKTKSRVRLDSTMPRLLKVLEKLGFECEWSDEWTTCDECGKLLRTQPDSYSWTPAYQAGDDGVVCVGCLDPEEHLSSLEGDATKANTIDSIDPADYGYKRLPEDYETGWHRGQDAQPKLVAKALEKQGIERYLFNIDDKDQFDVRWSAWVHEDEWDMLDEVSFAGERTDGPSVSGAAERMLREAAKATEVK